MTRRPAIALAGGVLIMLSGAFLVAPATPLAATDEPEEERPAPGPTEATPPRPIPNPSSQGGPQGVPAPTPVPVSAASLLRPDGTRPLDLGALAEKVARNPQVALLHNEYGNLLMKAARLEEALEQYTIATRLDPTSAWLWNNVGVAHQALQHRGAARRAFRHAIDLSPNYALAHYNLGVVYDSQGRYERAIDNYARAIDLDPGLLDIKKNPQIASNRHLAAIFAKSYLDRGGAVIFPTESALPKPARRGGAE